MERRIVTDTSMNARRGRRLPGLLAVSVALLLAGCMVGRA